MGRPPKYKNPTWLNGTIHPFYDQWKGVHRRCKETNNPKNKAYAGCYVCDKWNDYDNYFEWAKENYYKLDDEMMCLDKDILVKGNKIYSPTTCIFVPRVINQLFESSKGSRGNLPLGVTLYKHSGKYGSRVRIDGKTRFIGTFSTVEEAFCAYKNTKELYIKNIADKYINRIPDAIYKAIIEYKIDIDD